MASPLRICQPVSLSRSKPAAPCEKNRTCNRVTAKTTAPTLGNRTAASRVTSLPGLRSWAAPRQCGIQITLRCNGSTAKSVLAGKGQSCRNAFVEAVQCGHDSTDGGDHGQGDGRHDQGIFDQVLTFGLFPEISPERFHCFSSGCFDSAVFCCTDE